MKGPTKNVADQLLHVASMAAEDDMRVSEASLIEKISELYCSQMNS